MATIQERLKAFLDGLDQLPPAPGLSLRGRADDAEFVRPGQSVVTREITPTSRRSDVATEDGSAPALYAVTGRTGRDISPFSARTQDAEIVFTPGVLFHLAETRTLVGHLVHLVFELDPTSPTVPDSWPDRVAAMVEEALTRAATSDWPPADPPLGKFVGDIR